MRTGIILTTYGFWEMTREALDSLESAGGDLRLVAVDGGSADDTVERLRRRGVQVLSNPGGVSLATALNQGLEVLLAEGMPYLAWVHNDMVFFPGWLEGLVEVLERQPQLGKVAAWNLPGRREEWDDGRASAFMREHREEREPGNGCPWVMPVRVVRRVGGFDEGYLACGGYEDWDYNNRVLEAGFAVEVSRAGAVWHQGMGTRGRIGQGEAPRLNMDRYFRRWGPGPRV